MVRRALIAIVATAVLGSSAVGQGDLRRVQSALYPGPKYFAPEAPRRDGNGNWFNIDSPYQSALSSSAVPAAAGLGLIAVGVATLPLWGPHELFDAGFDQRGWFPAHPHVLDDRPYMVIGNCPNEPWNNDYYFDPYFIKPWSLRVSADGGTDFDNLTRFGGQLFVDTNIHRLGFLANLNYFQEQLTNGCIDDALMTDWNLTWRVTQSNRVLMHLGAGIRTWTYDSETAAGFNGLYRADWFPVNQVHLAAVFEAGTLREQFVMHGNVQGGFTFSHGELFIGYDFLRIRHVNLQGPFAGVRLWF